MGYWWTIKYYANLFLKGAQILHIWKSYIINQDKVQNTMGPAYYCVKQITVSTLTFNMHFGFIMIHTA